MSVPREVHGRFPGYDVSALLDSAPQPFLVLRLMEEGSGEELRWLLRTFGHDTLAALVATRGGRALSRRSRAFWERVLGVAASAPPPLARELWPLA